jgi:hypothetical protein
MGHSSTIHMDDTTTSLGATSAAITANEAIHAECFLRGSVVDAVINEGLFAAVQTHVCAHSPRCPITVYAPPPCLPYMVFRPLACPHHIISTLTGGTAPSTAS